MISKHLKIILPITIIIIVIGIIFLNVFHPSEQSSDQSNVSITNLSEFYPQIPEYTQENISAVLSRILQLNSITDDSLHEGSIRNSAPYLLTYDAQNQLYIGEFTVDFSSLQQAYRVSFSYSLDPNQAVANPVDVTCAFSGCNSLGQH